MASPPLALCDDDDDDDDDDVGSLCFQVAVADFGFLTAIFS